MWTVGMGRRERDRVKALEASARGTEKRPMPALDEIAQERGVQLVSEGKGETYFQ